MGEVWQFAGASREGNPFEIQGVNVWEQGWQTVEGEQAHVTDPVYGRRYIFKVFTIQNDEEKIRFAAGEFSPGEWGFYTHG